jgi:hypothetical protein
MELAFYEKYVLLTINDEKGTVAYGYSKTLGFAGAILIELSFRELVKLENKKLILQKEACKDSILNEALTIISTKKSAPKINTALHLLSNKMHKSFDSVIDNLINKGILAREQKKILWVFNVNHFPTKNAEPENQIKSKLRGIVLYGDHPDGESLQLLSLIDVLDLHREIFKKEEMKKSRKKIKELVKNSDILGGVNELIQNEITTAVALSIASSVAVNSATTG